jgi:hypothetical protein
MAGGESVSPPALADAKVGSVVELAVRHYACAPIVGRPGTNIRCTAGDSKDAAMSDAWELDGYIRVSQLKDREGNSQSPGQQRERIECSLCCSRIAIANRRSELRSHFVHLGSLGIDRRDARSPGNPVVSRGRHRAFRVTLSGPRRKSVQTQLGSAKLQRVMVSPISVAVPQLRAERGRTA